jgi:hypothetical protein
MRQSGAGARVRLLKEQISRRGIAMPRRFVGADRNLVFALAVILLGAVSAPDVARAQAQNLTSASVGATATAQSSLCYSATDPGQCFTSYTVSSSGRAAATYVAPPTASFPAGTANIGTATANATVSAPSNPTTENTANLIANANANSFYVAADAQAWAYGTFEVIAPNNSTQPVPVEVIANGDATASGTGWSYSRILVYGFGANDTFPTVEAEAETNYATPQSPTEGSVLSVDQTIMLEPDTVGTASLMIEAYAGEPTFTDVSPTPFALGCPTYCGTASADLDPEIEIAPSFLAANPGYELVFSPGFVPAASSDVPEPSTWAMMLLGFMALGFASRRASLRRVAALAAAIGLTAGAGSASAQAGGVSLTFTISGDPGTTIVFDPYPFGGGFQTSIRTNSGILIGSSSADFSLNFTGPENDAAPYGSDGVYQQALDGSGSFTITDANAATIGSATLSGGTAFATPDASSAVIELDVSSFSGSYFPGAATTGYLVLEGATQFPVDLVTTNALCTAGNPCTEPYFTFMRLDWTATYQTTPYAPGGSTVPEPTTWALMLLGFAGLGLAGCRRQAKRLGA